MTAKPAPAKQGGASAVLSVHMESLQPTPDEARQTAITLARAEFAVALVGAGILDCKPGETAGYASQVLGREPQTREDWVEAKEGLVARVGPREKGVV